jgi:CDP-6-deoxy-D-xylo-4-hexulose-3-dehydrase
MNNNITRDDLDSLITYLSQHEPRLTNGPQVIEFERQWSNWLGTQFSLMVNSGSSANDLTLMALKERFGPGKVMVSPIGWVSDISAILRSGLEPIFTDIELSTLAISPKQAINRLDIDIRAILLIHVLGLDGLDDSLLAEMARGSVSLIEDVCESHGARHNGRKLGTFGLASNFSFYFAHHMSTIEGGMISTDDPDLYDIVRMMRSHGLVRESLQTSTRETYRKKYPDLNPEFIFAYPSHNMRSTELNAVIGMSQLKRLDQNIAKRAENFRYFLSGLNSEVFFTEFKMEGNSNYALILILRDADFVKRDKIEATLRERRIEFRRGTAGGGNQLRQPYLRKIYPSLKPTDFPQADHVHNFGWYIGNFPGLDKKWIDDLHQILAEF